MVILFHLQMSRALRAWRRATKTLKVETTARVDNEHTKETQKHTMRVDSLPLKIEERNKNGSSDRHQQQKTIKKKNKTREDLLLLPLKNSPKAFFIHHFMTISSDCSICRQKDGDNPAHLFTKCEHGKLPYLPKFNDMQDAFMNKELLTAEQLFYHVWCVNKVSPNYICTLFWEAVSKTKKRAPS